MLILTPSLTIASLVADLVVHGFEWGGLSLTPKALARW